MLKLSVSSMDTYSQCAKRYFYRYIEKSDVKRAKWPWTEFGSCAHLVLEHFHNRANQSTPQEEWAGIMKQAFIDAVKEYGYRNVNQEQGIPGGGKRSGLAYLKEIIQSYLDDLKKNGMPNVIGNELSYEFEIKKDVIVRGFIDRVDRIDETTIRVVDYKTSKNPKSLKEFQLLVYAVALKQRFPEVDTIMGEFCMLKHDSARKQYVFKDFDLERCYDLIEERLELIESDIEWKKKPGFLCKYCDYERICLNMDSGDNAKGGDIQWT